MVGKRGKKGKKKGNEASNLSSIGAALFPSVAFAAVPKNLPAPNTPPGTGFGLSSGVLSASILNRMFTTSDQDDDPFSDPESSLYDYQNMDEAGYSTVEFGTLQRRRQGNISDRDSAIPISDTDDEQNDMQSPPQRASRMYHELETENADLEPMYSLPNKGHNSRSSDTLQQTTQDVREAMRRIHDEDDKIDRVPADDSDVVMRRVSARSHVSNKTPRSHRSSTSILSGRRSKSPMSGRSKSPRRISVEEENRMLQMELVTLRDKTESLRSEMKTFHQVARSLDDGDTETAKTILLKKQIQDLKDESETLKNSVHRLNIELSAYQAKYRPVGKDTGELKGLPSKGPIPSWLINTRYLSPLLLSYDDQLKERDNIIQEYKEELCELRAKMEDIIRENQTLHTKIDPAFFNGPISAVDWQNFQEQAKLVLEENQILLEQLSIQQRKVQDIHQVHIQEVSHLTKKYVVMKSEKEDTEKEIEETKRILKDIRQKYDAITMKDGQNVDVEEHINTVSELKRLINDKQEEHEKQTNNKSLQLEAVQNERKALAVEVVDLQAENKRLYAEIKAMHKSVRRAQQKMLFLQKAVEQSENKELLTQEQLCTIIKLAEKAAFERDTYAKVAQDQEVETKKALNKVLKETLFVGRMEEKLKTYKEKAATKLSTVGERLKEQEDQFNIERQEYAREIKHLRLILIEKEQIIDNLKVDKRDTEENLEAMWQSASSENNRIRDTLRKSFRKMREHDCLQNSLDEKESNDAMLAAI